MNPFGNDRIYLNSHNLLDMRPEQILNERYITLDDSFRFRCKACGKCCKQRHDISLTAYDVYRLAGFFGKLVSELITQYCDVVEPPDYPLRGVYLRMRNGTCPFLRNKRCFVHAVKPGVCRAFPLGRVFWHDGAGSYYNVNSTLCKHEPQTIQVRDWVGDFATEEAEKIGELWNSTCACIINSMLSGTGFKDATAARQETIKDFTFRLLFIAYDVKEPFLPQLEKNVINLREMMDSELGFKIISVEDYRQKLADEGHPLSPPNSTRRKAD